MNNSENKSHKWFTPFVVVIAIILLAGIVFLNLTVLKSEKKTEDYMKPIEASVKAMETNDFENLEKYLLEAEFNSGYSKSQYVKTYFDEEVYKSQMEEYKQQLGDNLKFSYDVKEKKRLEKDELEDVQQALEKKTDKKVSVTDGYIITVDLVISGDKDELVQTGSYAVVKINDKWYLNN